MQMINCFWVSKKQRWKIALENRIGKWEIVDLTDILSTDLLATADSAGAKWNILAKFYYPTEKVLVENERFSTFHTKFS